MIDSNVLSAVERRVAQDMKDRRDVFSREVAQIRESAVVKGTLHSSTTALLTLDTIGNELRVRASLIWQAFAQALSAKGILINGAISSEIKQYVSQMLNNHSSDLPEHYGRLKGLVRDFVPPKCIFELTTSALDRINTEIDYAVLRHSAPSEPTTGVVNIYQSYGIVQTGSGASASLTIQFGTEERREVELALEAVLQAIEAASLRPGERDQALELVSDVKRELQRDQPNRLRIRGALQGLATVIQTLAAAPQAYQLLKGAAALLGLQLP